jgi:hypothetical protein
MDINAGGGGVNEGGLIWLRIDVADSYIHDENGVGKWRGFSGLCEQLSVKVKESSMYYVIIMLMSSFPFDYQKDKL